MSAAQLPDLSIETVELETQSTRFELEFHCWEQADGLRFVIFYNRDLFAAATAAGTRMVAVASSMVWLQVYARSRLKRPT